MDKEGLNRFDDRSFHTVVCTEVLEHLDNFHEIFDEICRIAKNNIIISLPNSWARFKFSLISGKSGHKFYGLPVEKPLDRHKWFFNYEQALNFLKVRGKRNNFNIKSKFSIPYISNSLKLQLFNFFFKIYYRNQLKFDNLFYSSLWVLLERQN